MPRRLFSGEEAENPRNMNNAWIRVPVCEFLRSCFRIFDAMSILNSYLVRELNNSVSVMISADSAILFLSPAAEFNEPFLTGSVDVPRRGRHETIAES
jgi:hypothetical protein